jgi:hypothetical protein
MLSALFSLFAGVAGFEVADSFRWCGRRRLCKALAVMVPLALAAGGGWWLDSRYPTLNFWVNQEFGPGWACQNPGRGDALVCLRDLDRRRENGRAVATGLAGR